MVLGATLSGRLSPRYVCPKKEKGSIRNTSSINRLALPDGMMFMTAPLKRTVMRVGQFFGTG
ncbi:MAG TPA: hypothetical protein PKH10_08950 [bacterium]|nr:hypothetical protein [bacterium]